MKAIQQFERLFGIKITRTKHWEMLAMLVSLEIVLAFSYLGYLHIPPVSITTMHIFVLVAAMFFGPWDAAVVALVFGLTSMWIASLTSTGDGDAIFSPSLSGEPVKSILVALGARLLFAIIAGFAFRIFFSKPRKRPLFDVTVISVISTILHTVLVLGSIGLLFDSSAYENSVNSIDTLLLNELLMYMITIGVIIFSYRFMLFARIQTFLRTTAEAEMSGMKKRSGMINIIYTLLIISSIFIAIHFISRLVNYFETYGSDISEEYKILTYSLVHQFIVGFAGVFGILFISVRWVQEYYSARILEANIRARKNAEIANESKTAFLFNMSHDIRTPMNAIVGFTSMAIKHIDERDKALDCLKKTQESGNLLLSLINSILDVSRIESGNAVLELQNGNVYYSFANLESTMQEMAAIKNITLTFEFGEITDKYVSCDINRCVRIFVNIISNSIKYTKEGGIINVRCEQVGKVQDGYATYRYTFEDNGIGMSKEFQQHVYEQFSREETTTVSGIQGTGLGLSVCKSFVDLMGGKIECTSEQGKGTTFTVTLPFKIQEGECYTDPVTQEQVSAVSNLHLDYSPELNGHTVLIVEDNEMNREIAEDILSDEGMIIETACNGAEAVELLRSKGPDYYDFILMDIQMPVMNGYEATRELRKLYPGKHIPIIALSANAFSEDRAASLAAGMDDHVAKPINTEELFMVMARHKN